MPFRQVPAPAVFALLLSLSACQPALDGTGSTAVPVPAPSTPNPAVPADGERVEATFRCGDMLVDSVFDNLAGNVALSINARQLVLPQAVSASGARYANEDGSIEFWNKGDAASFTLDGTTHACSATDDPSPWAEARKRGVLARGIGTEPSWWAEVERSEHPVLRADLGGRKLEITPITANAGATAFTGLAGDGTLVTLSVFEGECSDGMSDQGYPARVELAVGEQTYRGCGGFLQP